MNRIKYIVAKGENALYEQCVLLPQHFQQSSAAVASVCGKGLLHMKLFVRDLENV